MSKLSPLARTILTACTTHYQKESKQTQKQSKEVQLGNMYSYGAPKGFTFEKLFKCDKKALISCPTCAGRGWTKAFTGVGNDYNEENCRSCHGTRTIQAGILQTSIRDIAKKRKSKHQENIIRYRAQRLLITELDQKGIILKFQQAGLHITPTVYY